MHHRCPLGGGSSAGELRGEGCAGGGSLHRPVEEELVQGDASEEELAQEGAAEEEVAQADGGEQACARPAGEELAWRGRSSRAPQGGGGEEELTCAAGGSGRRGTHASGELGAGGGAHVEGGVRGREQQERSSRGDGSRWSAAPFVGCGGGGTQNGYRE
ncbi:hypothetical protein PR202_gb03394 [Eleusine coracana subsp. coracana]|uniref:Uncharacterized protein n=1 Tax=Eleusine coracana subsp. coracana TaxID=191504 RepID=A0AAV5DZB9_ELECO|nr:hypothetical protein PR202_gb03394 [Eleusine coracana subsp. coracana]